MLSAFFFHFKKKMMTETIQDDMTLSEYIEQQKKIYTNEKWTIQKEFRAKYYSMDDTSASAQLAEMFVRGFAANVSAKILVEIYNLYMVYVKKNNYERQKLQEQQQKRQEQQQKRQELQKRNRQKQTEQPRQNNKEGAKKRGHCDEKIPNTDFLKTYKIPKKIKRQ